MFVASPVGPVLLYRFIDIEAIRGRVPTKGSTIGCVAILRWVDAYHMSGHPYHGSTSVIPMTPCHSLPLFFVVEAVRVRLRTEKAQAFGEVDGSIARHAVGDQRDLYVILRQSRKGFPFSLWGIVLITADGEGAVLWDLVRNDDLRGEPQRVCEVDGV